MLVTMASDTRLKTRFIPLARFRIGGKVSSSPSSVVVVSHEGAISMSAERMFVSSLEKDILLE